MRVDVEWEDAIQHVISRSQVCRSADDPLDLIDIANVADCGRRIAGEARPSSSRTHDISRHVPVEQIEEWSTSSIQQQKIARVEKFSGYVMKNVLIPAEGYKKVERRAFFGPCTFWSTTVRLSGRA